MSVKAMRHEMVRSAAPESPTARLAAFCAGLRYEDIPADVIEKAKLCVLDSIGAMIGGATTSVVAAVRRASKQFNASGPSTVFGWRSGTSPTTAALINGTALDAFDFEDGWRFGNNHPSVVIPGALSVAELLGASGKDFLTAVVAGYEIANRVAYAVAPMHLAAGYLPTGTTGTIGSAAAAARLLGHDAEMVAAALTTAAFIFPISNADTLWHGYSAKPLHVGYAARQGLEAALLANEGIAASPIEGFGQAGEGSLKITTGNVHLSRLTDHLGASWSIRDVYFKAMPACRHVHGAAEATLSIMHDQLINNDDVSEIVVHTYSLAASKVNAYTDISSPAAAAQMSIPYVIAAALVDGRVGTTQFSEAKIRDTHIQALARKVRVESDPAFDAVYPEQTPTRVKLRMCSGQEFSAQINTPKGDPRVPLSRPELIEKFKASATLLMPAADADEFEKTVFRLESLSSIGELTALARSSVRISGDT